jgi:hypothetical protein
MKAEVPCSVSFIVPGTESLRAHDDWGFGRAVGINSHRPDSNSILSKLGHS